MLRKSHHKSIILGISLLIFWVLSILDVFPEGTGLPTTAWEESSEASVAGQIDTSELYFVSKIVDGDTFKVIRGDEEISVRLIGIDTPELSHFGNEEMCYARESTQKLSELILNKQVRLVTDVSETDRYGRLLRYVYLDDIFINKVLVEEGFAKALTYPPDIKYADTFMKSEQAARVNNKGLWGITCNEE